MVLAIGLGIQRAGSLETILMVEYSKFGKFT